MASVNILHLRSRISWITPEYQSFRPPSWPPPRDWVVSEEQDGSIVSLWGDEIWNLSSWAGVAMRLDFRIAIRRKANKIDIENSEILRMMTTWRMWGTRACTTPNSLKGIFLAIKRVISICSDNNIIATDLPRFPRVIDAIAKCIPSSEFSKTILEFHRLWDAREQIGFYVITPVGIQRWVLATPDRKIVQTPYIPPRIWAYQIERLRECIDDFLNHSEAIEECFQFCLDAYIKNYGSLKNSLFRTTRHRLPFWTPPNPGKGSVSGCIYRGPFHLTAERFKIAEVIEKWTGIPANELDIRNLSSYLSIVQYVCMGYIANFTLQRINEVASLRSDCLKWETDEILGRIPLICGETTKTQVDSDARWPTTQSIEVAVKAICLISKWRMKCSKENPIVNPTEYDTTNPYIFGTCNDPWNGGKSRSYNIRPHVPSYINFQKRNSKVFDEKQLRITEEDHRIAVMLTPSIINDEAYKVGKVWPFAWHQLRRTVAVNMFASNLLSDSSMQFQMKHSSRLMPLYYGRGFTKIALNHEVEETIITAMYETMAHKLQGASTDRFVSPLGDDRKETVLINLIKDKDFKQLILASRRGQIQFRETKVGACTHRGTCTYGGIESISRCTGGDGNGPCAEALYDKYKEKDIEKEIAQLNLEIAATNPTSPRHLALLAEKQGMENYLYVIRK